MGKQAEEQNRQTCTFNLDTRVPQHLRLRGINRFFDLRELRQHLAPSYHHTDRRSIDPELMILMLASPRGAAIKPLSNSNYICCSRRGVFRLGQS
jgi:hypothetical protein